MITTKDLEAKGLIVGATIKHLGRVALEEMLGKEDIEAMEIKKIELTRKLVMLKSSHLT